MRNTPALTLLIVTLWLLPTPASALPPAPDSPGPFAVGRTSVAVTDDSRGRPLVVDVWYPVDPADAVGDPAFYEVLVFGLDSETAIQDAPVSEHGPFPLVVFSHGNGGLRFQSFFLTEMLASHGFVVIAPDHTGNTLIDLLLFPPTDEDILQSALDRPRDVSFLISWMLARSRDPSDEFHHRIDRRQIGVTGHSFGGFTTLAVAAGFDGEAAAAFGIDVPDDFVPIPADHRVKAILPIAPASTPLGDGELARIRIPTLLLGGTADATTPIDPETERPWQHVRGRPLYRADLRDAGHFSFTNVCDLIDLVISLGLPPDLVDDLISGAFDEGCAGDLLPIAEAHRITNLYAVSFLRAHLAHDGRYRRFLRPRYALLHEPDVDFQLRPRPWRPIWARWLKPRFWR